MINVRNYLLTCAFSMLVAYGAFAADNNTIASQTNDSGSVTPAAPQTQDSNLPVDAADSVQGLSQDQKQNNTTAPSVNNSASGTQQQNIGMVPQGQKCSSCSYRKDYAKIMNKAAPVVKEEVEKYLKDRSALYSALSEEGKKVVNALNKAKYKTPQKKMTKGAKK